METSTPSSIDALVLNDALVCAAYMLASENTALRNSDGKRLWPYDLLMLWTGQDGYQCHCAMKSAEEKFLIDYDISWRTGWVTDEGRTYLRQSRLDVDALLKGVLELPAPSASAVKLG